MPKYPTVAILLAVRNQKNYVREAIESVLAQTSDDWELIIVDDGSDDGTRDVLREYSDPRIHTYRLSNSRGKAKCLNEALARSTGRFLLELDGDDWLEPTAVEEIIKLAGDWPNDVACIYGNVYTHMQRGNAAIPLLVQKGRPYKDKYDFLLNCDFFAPRIWKRSAVESVGGWPEGDGPYEGRVREAHGLAIRLLAQYQIAYRDFTVYNYRKHPESLTARYGRRNAWSTKKQDIVTALKLWKAQYTPFFDDFLHLIFLRPDPPTATSTEVVPPQEETPPKNLEPPSRSSSFPSTQGTSAAEENKPQKHRTSEPIIIDTTKETAAKIRGPEPQLIEVPESSAAKGSAPTNSTSYAEGGEREAVAYGGITQPTAVHIPGFPVRGSRTSSHSQSIARPQPVNWLQMKNSVVQEHLPKQNPMPAHTNEYEFNEVREQRAQAWVNQFQPAWVFFCPIGSVGATGEQSILHTKFADLLCQYLSKELGGAALPVSITLRETQSNSAYGGTYLDSPAYIQERITALLKNQLPPSNPLLVLVPGLSNSRTVHLLRTAIPNLIDTSVIVINPGDTLIDAGIAETSQAETDWLKMSVEFLEHTLGISDASPVVDLSQYFARLVERVKTEVKLAVRRKQLKS